MDLVIRENLDGSILTIHVASLVHTQWTRHQLQGSGGGDANLTSKSAHYLSVSSVYISNMAFLASIVGLPVVSQNVISTTYKCQFCLTKLGTKGMLDCMLLMFQASANATGDAEGVLHLSSTKILHMSPF